MEKTSQILIELSHSMGLIKLLCLDLITFNVLLHISNQLESLYYWLFWIGYKLFIFSEHSIKDSQRTVFISIEINWLKTLSMTVYESFMPINLWISHKECTDIFCIYIYIYIYILCIPPKWNNFKYVYTAKHFHSNRWVILASK